MLLIEAVTDVKHVPICIFIFNRRDSTMRPADESSTLSVQSSAAAAADNNRDVFLQLIRPSTSCCTTLCVSHSFISANYSSGNYFPAHIRSCTKRAEQEKAKHGPAYFFPTAPEEKCAAMWGITFGLMMISGGTKSTP